MLGTFALASGYYDAYYLRAQKVRTLIRRDFAAAFEQVDVIVSPTSPTVAFRLGERVQDPLAMYLSDVCTIPSSLAGPPGAVDPLRPLRRPAGRAAARRPGLQREPPARRRPRARGRDRLRPAPAGGPDEHRARWEPVIGLEIHVQLSTRTKMFCGCELSFGDPPNTHTCPVCLAHPGALPVINRAGGAAGRCWPALALGCEVPPRSEFHRKNYFYPDLSKAYQISQYDEPLCVDGRFDVLLADGRELDGGHHPRPPRGGRGQARPRRRRRAARRGRGLGRRLQPGRHAAAGDRHRARPALGRRRRRVPAPAAPDAAPRST